jgi:hypothetical protein
LRASGQGFSPVRDRDGNIVDRIFVLAASGLFVCFVQVCLSEIEVVRSEIRGVLCTRRSDDSLGFADI